MEIILFMRTKLFILFLSLSIAGFGQDLTTKKQVSQPVDSLGWFKKVLRYTGQDFVSLSGVSYRVHKNGTIHLNKGIERMSVAGNILVMWTGNPTSFAAAAKAKGLKNLLSWRRLRHIWQGHAPYSNAANKVKFMRGTNYNELLRLADETLNGVTRERGGYVAFYNEVKNIHGFTREYCLVMTKEGGEIITLYPTNPLYYLNY